MASAMCVWASDDAALVVCVFDAHFGFRFQNSEAAFDFRKFGLFEHFDSVAEL